VLAPLRSRLERAWFRRSVPGGGLGRSRFGGVRNASEGPSTVTFRRLGARGYGHLGNQLWQMAGTLGLASTLGAEARFPLWRHQNRFCVPAEHFTAEPLRGRDASTIPQHIAKGHRRYLQDPALWLHMESTIRRYFSLEPTHRAALEAKFSSMLAIPDKTALHIRRGDYQKKQQFHPVPSDAYLRAALERVAGSNIVVFSDDIAWCRQNLGWAEPALFMEGNADYEDLFLIAACERHILANSSFSWWGAFLSDNPSPIYPTRWYGPAFDDVDPTLFFLEKWVGLDS
jgi:hypothetical protein